MFRDKNPFYSAELAFARRVVSEIARDFPQRRAGSDAERFAQGRVQGEFERIGVAAQAEAFEWNTSLHQTLALHFGVGTLGSLVAGASPGAAALLHLIAGGSYWADSTRTGYLLRRLLPRRWSRNLVATLPAQTGEPRLRVVFAAHIDSAYTGLVFHPLMVSAAAAGRDGVRQSYFARSLEVATDAELALFATSAIRAVFGIAWPWFRAVELVLAVPALLAFGLNLEVVLRNRTVTGAADNLSGVASTLLLAQRFVVDQPDDVEFVFAITGAEEAGTGGAYRLAEARANEWNPENTIVIGVDTTTNGDLRWFREGEVEPMPTAPWLETMLKDAVRAERRFASVRPFQMPVGSTDAAPFLARGYPAVTIGCYDADYGAPRHYHRPTDVAANVDYPHIVYATDFIELVARKIIRDL